MRRQLRGQRRRDRQDTQRGARRRLRAQLLRRRHDAAVRAAGRRVLRAHRRSRFHRASCGRRSPRHCAGSTCTATSTATASSRRGRAARAMPPHHGWKSSPDAVFHADGRLAQGRWRCAKCRATSMARSSARRASRARSAKCRAPSRWWKPRRRCRRDSTPRSGATTSRPLRWRSMATSNPAACARRIRAIACSPASRMPSARARSSPGLGDEQLFSGWGVRTVAESELRYNPMSYHNGSIWPHDNALIAAGAARYDDKAFALRILECAVRGGAPLRPAAPAGAVLRLPAHGAAKRRCNFRSPARRSPAPPAPPSCCCRACSASRIDALDRQIVLAHPVVPDGFEEISVQQPRPSATRRWISPCGGTRESVSVSVERREGKAGPGDPELNVASPRSRALSATPTATVCGAVLASAERL